MTGGENLFHFHLSLPIDQVGPGGNLIFFIVILYATSFLAYDFCQDSASVPISHFSWVGPLCFKGGLVYFSNFACNLICGP